MAVITVTTLNDVIANDGFVSLREAVQAANTNLAVNEAAAGSGADTIRFQAGLTGTITLTGELSLTQDVTIDGDTSGDDKADIILSGGNLYRVFNVGASVHATLLSLTLTNGYAGNGGAIYSNSSSSTLDIVDTTISNSTAISGGGGIVANGVLNLTNSTVSGNYAASFGGALLLSSYTTAVLVNTTLSGNSAAQYGGAIDMNTGVHLTIANSTISGNSHLGSSTLAGGINLFGGSVLTITNSVVAQNTDGTNPDISEYGANSTIHATNSFFGSATGLVRDTDVSNQFGNAMLGALADNGGTVQTRAILAGSPLIGAGDAGELPDDTFDLDGDGNASEDLPFDATGGARVNGLLDIGAFEADYDLTVTTVNDTGDNTTTPSTLAGDTADGGGLSLREAIFHAASGAKIGFSSALANMSAQVNVGSVLALSQDITIDGDADGDGDVDISISGSGGTRIFDITGGDVILESLFLTGGDVAGSGGAIQTASGSTLLLNGVTVANSYSSAHGGAVHTAGKLIAINSTFYANTADVTGGAISVGGTGQAILLNATLTGNTAYIGGAISGGAGAQISLYSSTISGNDAEFSAGGIRLFAGVSLESVNSVIAGNTDDDGNPDAEVDASSTFESSFSFLGTGVVLTDGGNNLRGNDPMLGALADNGGPVRTMRPLDGSLLNGAGSNLQANVGQDVFDLDGDGNTTELTPIDARGAQRIVGTVDIGAYERSNRAPGGANDSNGGDTVKEDTDTTATGNVLTNDTDFNIGDTKTVNGLRSGSEAAGGGFGAVGTVTGIYGSLTLNANGTWTYTLNNADPDTNALAEGATAHDFFTYRVTDTLGLTDIAQLVITITGANDHAPVITSNGGSAAQAIIEVNENTTAVTTVTSTDVDGPARTYSISGNDAALFAINATTGVLTFLSAPDAEAPSDSDHNGSYFLFVTASDGDLSDTQDVAVLVSNLIDGRTIVGHKTKADTINGSKPSGNAATINEDKINGRGGNDTIKSLGGDDTVKGGLGADVLDGGGGTGDVLDFSDMTKAVVLTLKGNKTATATVGGVADDKVKNFEDVLGGKAGDKLTGDGQNNLLSGNAGNDSLSGGKAFDILIGGLGADSLTGGAAFDRFVFNTKLGSGNIDKLTDFKHDGDVIELDDAIFTAIGPTLDANEFKKGAGFTSARDADDRIVYNKTTGDLYFDADGNKAGGKAAIHFATLTTKPATLDAGDFNIV